MNKYLIITCAVAIIILLFTILIGFYIKRKKRRKLWIDRFEQVNMIPQEESDDVLTRDAYENNNILLKIQMYIISLWLLFLLIIPVTVQFIPEDKIEDIQSFAQFLLEVCRKNILPLICLFMVIVCFVLFKQLEYRWKGSRRLSVKVKEIEDNSFEYLAFLTTYIIPLVCMNLDEFRYVFVLFILLIIIGIIFVRSEFYLGNPTLALMNYRLYKIRYISGDVEYEKLIITKDKIKAGDLLESIPFDQNTWYVRRSR